MKKNLRFLIFLTLLLSTQSSACELDSNYNYFLSSPLARQLLEELGIFTDGPKNHILNGRSYPNIYFSTIDTLPPETSKKRIIHLEARGPDIFNNTWSMLLSLEPYLKDCSEPFFRLMSNINNAKQLFKKFGDIKNQIVFTKGQFIDDQNLKEFQEKFNLILFKYGLNRTPKEDDFKIEININRIVRNHSEKLRYLNFVNSTSTSIQYSYFTTNINADDYHSFESLIYLVRAISLELPIRFRHESRLGWGKSAFKYIDSFSEYEIQAFIRALTLLFIFTYTAINFNKIRDAWRGKV